MGRDDSEHAFVFRNAIATDRLRKALIEAAEASIDAKLLRARRPREWPRRLEKRLRVSRDDAAARLLVAAGLHPNTLQVMRKWGWRRGGLIRARKRLTG